MPRAWTYRVQDILTSIERIQRYTAGMSYEAFCADEKTVDAVILNLAIVGEAARHIPSEIEAAWPGVPWQEMRGIRNVLIHGYFGIDLAIVWQTVTHDLPPLIPILTELLESAD